MKKYRHCKNSTASRHQIYDNVGADSYVRPTVPFRTAVTACAPEFTTLVGADSHVRPTVPSRTAVTACATKLWLRVNKMDKWIDCTDATRLGGHIEPPITPVDQSAILFLLISLIYQKICSNTGAEFKENVRTINKY